LHIEVRAQERQDVLGVLIGHETEIDFGERLGRQDSLAAWALVATRQPADRARRVEQVVPARLPAIPAAQESGDAEQALILGHGQRLAVCQVQQAL